MNAVAPGPTYTPYTEQFGAALDQLMAPYPLAHPGTANQLAEAILFLASQRASHITGAVLPIDGGKPLSSDTLRPARTPSRASRPGPTRPVPPRQDDESWRPL